MEAGRGAGEGEHFDRGLRHHSDSVATELDCLNLSLPKNGDDKK